MNNVLGGPMYLSTGEMLKVMRMRHGITRRQLAEMTSLTPEQIVEIEQDNARKVTVAALVEAFSVFGISMQIRALIKEHVETDGGDEEE